MMMDFDVKLKLKREKTTYFFLLFEEILKEMKKILLKKMSINSSSITLFCGKFLITQHTGQVFGTVKKFEKRVNVNAHIQHTSHFDLCQFNVEVTLISG
jgi:hypothetical protein